MKSRIKPLTLIPANLSTYQCQVGIHQMAMVLSQELLSAAKNKVLYSVLICEVFGSSRLLQHEVVSAEGDLGAPRIFCLLVLTLIENYCSGQAVLLQVSLAVKFMDLHALLSPTLVACQIPHTHGALCGFQARERGYSSC